MTKHILPQPDAPSASPPPDDFTDLVLEIVTVESLPPRLAQAEASALEDSLIAYAALWDAWAWCAGNTSAFAWL